MATNEEKEELLQTLKFTPVKVNIRIQGYGGECYIGSVSRETYEFFKSKRIDIDQYASSWDDDERFNDIPVEHRFIDPGSAYECDNLFHQSGATMDSGSYITVTNDETGEDIFETSLDISGLEDQGIEVSCDEDFASTDLEPGSVIFWGGQGEKGCFFDGELTLRAPFDPKKLTVSYGNGDDWYIVSGVMYDGEDIEGQDGYSTTGKWTEHKFWIVGDEEVYEGEERDDDYEAVFFTEDQKTEWHPRDLKPAHKGEYEVVYDAEWPNGGVGRAEWTGRSWKQAGKKLSIRQWRGLREPALVE